MMSRSSLPALALTAAALGLSACATTKGPPSNIENACSIAEERGGWYRAARRSAKKWKVPTPVILAIIWRESQFEPEAETPRQYALGVIPWGRQSSAYGFAQAIDGTWDWYQTDQDAGDADRENFADAADFVGWYMQKTRKRLGIAVHDARTHYLAYHEGHGGYQQGKWREKDFLVRASAQVERMASVYDAQLRGCDAEYARERQTGVASTPVPKRPPFGLSDVAGMLPSKKPGSEEAVDTGMQIMPAPKPLEDLPEGP